MTPSNCWGVLLHLKVTIKPSLVAQMVKNLPVMQETWVLSLAQDKVIDISPGNLDSSLCFIQSGILHDVGTGEPGGLPSMGLHRVGHD